MSLDVTWGAAAVAGALSFLSPCVLPLVPPYLCYVSGVSLDDLSGEDVVVQSHHRQRVMLAALCFVLGFTTVFVLLGATASAAGALLRAYLPLLSTIAALAIIAMGLNFLGLFRLAFLSREKRYHHQGEGVTLLGAYGIGLAFAFGWTPCIGPVLAAILSIAGSTESVATGMALLATYSLGLGIPFLIAAFSLDSFLGFFRKFRRHLPLVEKIMGALLVLTGLLFLTGGMQTISYWLLDFFPWLASIG
ncbi:MAG: cytochrome c biogenesis protein CcdA [Hyphomicrobiales bacterium]